MAHVNSAGRFWPDPRRYRTKIAMTCGNRPALVEIQCHCWSSTIPSGPKPKWEAHCQGYMEKSEDVNSPVPPSANNWLSTKIHQENFVLER